MLVGSQRSPMLIMPVAQHSDQATRIQAEPGSSEGIFLDLAVARLTDPLVYFFH